MMENKERRDFIAKEIYKRIIGPGFTEGALLCNEDASDEILDNRPSVVYTGGILFPQNRNGSSEQEDDISSDIQEIEEIESSDNEEDTGNNMSDASYKPSPDEQLNLGIAERADFMPSHIGLITCVDEEAQSVSVDVKYGIYHLLNESEKKEDNNVCKNVKVKLGVCSLKQLKETFEYYNADKNLLTEIGFYGAKDMSDLFLVDETNLTISPRRIFEREDSESKKSIYLKASIFPELARNKVARVLIKLFRNPSNEVEIPNGLSEEQLKNEIIEISKLSSFAPILKTNNWENIKGNLTFKNQKIGIHNKKFSVPNDININDILYVNDPVKNHLLPLLLQYRYFKREQKILQRYELSLIKDVGEYLLPDSDESLKLRWKVMIRADHNGTKRKYIKILLQNNKTKNRNQLSEDFIHQAELKVSSPHIVSYSEPHHSSIADKEYDVNEEIYRDIKIYAKGVNCGATWNDGEKVSEVMTTYAPSQLAIAFDPESKDEAIKNACDVFDLSIWSKITKEEVLKRFDALAESYKQWHNEQCEIAKGNNILNDIISEQSDFYNRLLDNIDYLRNNDNAYNCFMIANTAMYIQMVISRDPFFKKNRERADISTNDMFKDTSLWERFKKGDVRPKYRPFQLAFLLMNVKSTFEVSDAYRKDNVDLIWFPTGGGKTEAYLALTALTIAKRRLEATNDNGISVIMRYTLRLLTAQQFERASFLICALEYLRNNLKTNKCPYNLGNNPITIGMWIGASSTPNTFMTLNQAGTKFYKYRRYLDGETTNISSDNPFPISYCPWCGCKLVAPAEQGTGFIHGYADLYDGEGNVHCINQNCTFNNSLPIIFIDEQLYKNPPTLLFATVDKFAQITTKYVCKMFGCNVQGRRKPDLIIQDELHLISGPLGSLVGMFESMVEEICTERDNNGNVVRTPKIIASTATTRNTQNLIKQLYTRRVRSFPVSGVRYKNNFFSKALEFKDCKRLYMGLAPTGHSASELEIRAVAAQIVAKEQLIVAELKSRGIDLNNKEEVAKFLVTADNSTFLTDIDNYWTLVLYYTNLKSLGRAHSRIGQEIKANAESMRGYIDEYPALNFIGDNFHLRAQEFTSRQESSRVKELLVEAESKTNLTKNSESMICVTSIMDIVQATNMISVGIDIARWNIMMLVGQPLTTAEYIQSSSRVGRTFDGLAINLYNPLNMRELSLYENYLPYHYAFYKHVEPLMVTTFTEQTIDKLINNIFLSYMAAIKGYTNPSEINANDIDKLKKLLNTRCKNTYVSNSNSYLSNIINNKIDSIYNEIETDYRYLSIIFDDHFNHPKLKLMKSLRDVESDTYIYYKEN